jgi:hypothetical protein
MRQLVSNSVAVTSAPAPYDPEAEAIIQAAENADEAHQAELTQQINKLFDNEE